MLSSGVGWGSVCKVSHALSWLSLRALGPHAILCRSHVQMWLAGLSVDGTQAWRAPACLVLHPPVPMTVQPVGGVGGRYGNEKGSEVVAQHSHGGMPRTLVSAHSDAGDGGATGWTMLTVGSQMAWSGECRRLKVELFPAEAREDSTEKWLGGHGSRRRGHHGLEGAGRKPGTCARSSLEEGVRETRWHRLLLPRLVYPVETESSPSKKNNLGSGSKTFRRQARQAKIGRWASIHWKDFCARQDSTE